MPRIVLAGGGTGGHITPILNSAQALSKSDQSLELHIVTEQGQVADDLLAHKPWQLHKIHAGKWRRYGGVSWSQQLFDLRTWGQNIVDLFKFLAGLCQSLVLLIKLRPKVVFVKGGYVGLPVGIASWILHIPLIIHESDVAAGLTNRILAHLSRTIATGWPTQYYPDWQHKKLVFTGNLTSSEPAGDRAQALDYFKLNRDLPVMLVMGGSRGAQVLNQTILDHLEALLHHYQIIHITGSSNYQTVLDKLPKTPLVRQRYRPYAFLTSELNLAYAVADIFIARAGANSLAEIALTRKPAIIVPHRYSPAGHQAANAAILDNADAAIVIRDEELDKKLMQSLEEIRQHPERGQQLAKNLGQFAKNDAAKELAGEIRSLL